MFLQIETYRLMAHSKSDDDRDPAEVQSYWVKDPVTRFFKESSEEAERIQSVINDRIEAAVALADAAPYTSASEDDEDSPDCRVPHWRPHPHRI